MFRFSLFIITAAVLVCLGAMSVAAQQAKTSAEPSATPGLATPSATPAASPNFDSGSNERLPFMADTDRGATESAPSAGGLILRTLGALLLIVGLIVAASWTLKRVGGPRFGAPQEDAPQLAVLNSLSLGDKRSLSIVRFGQRTLLLGSTSQSVTLLAEGDFKTDSRRARSVAELLNEDEPVSFAGELLAATEGLGPANEEGDA